MFNQFSYVYKTIKSGLPVLLEIIIAYYAFKFYTCSLYIIFKQTPVIIRLDNSLG